MIRAVLQELASWRIASCAVDGALARRAGGLVEGA
jgi:hypothetical protein